MKLLLQMLFLFLAWLTNLANAIPVFTKILLPNYENTILKKENVRGESTLKI